MYIVCKLLTNLAPCDQLDEKKKNLKIKVLADPQICQALTQGFRQYIGYQQSTPEIQKPNF